MSKILNSRRARIYPEADVKRAEISLQEDSARAREIMDGAWGMGHGAWATGQKLGMGHGAWGIGHGAWGIEENNQSPIQNPCIQNPCIP